MSLVTSNLQIHYDFSNTSCYPGTGTTVTNLGLAGTTYNGLVNADSIRAGTAAGTVPTFSSDKGGVFSFSGNKSRITIPHGNTVNGITNNTVYRTFQMWVKFNSLSNGLGGTVAPIIGKLSPASGFDGYIMYPNTSGSLRVTLNAAGESVPATANGVITTGQWYFLTYVINTGSVANRVKMFNGSTQLTITPSSYSGTWSVSETNPLQLGTGFMNPTASTYGLVTPGQMESFIGEIGGFYLYDRELTSTEVSTNYNATKARFESASLKYWNGSSWATPISKQQWNGSAWVTMDGEVWDGTSWRPIL